MKENFFMYSREKYFKVRQEILDSGLSICGYFKKINKSPGPFYKSRNLFDSDCEIEPIFVTRIEEHDNKVDDEPLNISAPVTFDANFSTGEFIIVNGLKIEGNANFLKEVLVKLLKESKNV